jgi:hypothetical protein
VGEVDADGLVWAQGESGAVEDIGSGSTPDVGFVELCVGVSDNGCDVCWDFAADAEDSAAAGEVASVDGESAAGDLSVEVELLGLVFADGESVAVFGVRYSVEPCGVAECCWVAPPIGTTESPHWRRIGRARMRARSSWIAGGAIHADG